MSEHHRVDARTLDRRTTLRIDDDLFRELKKANAVAAGLEDQDILRKLAGSS